MAQDDHSFQGLSRGIGDIRLLRNLTLIQEAAESIWNPEAPRVIHAYTDHGPPHSSRVAEYVTRLLKAHRPGPLALSAKERYVLLAGIHLHDIGMQCDVARFPEIVRIAKDLGAEFKCGFTAPTANDYTGEEQAEIRENHHFLSAAWIRFARANPETVLSSAARGIPDDLVGDVMDVCIYHARLPIEQCGRMFRNYGEERKQLVAALLRFGDELDVQTTRVKLETVLTFHLDPRNSLYWWLHSRTIIDFIGYNVIKLKVRLCPADERHYGGLVKEAVVDRFRKKNESVLEVLREYDVKIALDADSGVHTDSIAEPLPREIIAMFRKGDEGTQPALDLEFANRVRELDTLCDPDRPSIVIDAPAGYGKTYLLGEVLAHHKNGRYPGWACTLIDLGEKPGRFQVVETIIRSVGVTPLSSATLEQLAEQLVAAILKCGNLLLLFDTADAAPPRLVEWLKYEWIPGLRKRLATESGEARIRVVFAGRQITAQHPFGWDWPRTEYGDPLKLESFREATVRELVAKTAQKSEHGRRAGQVTLDTGAREIWTISGGHPAIIKTLIQHLDEQQWQDGDISRSRVQLFDRFVAPRIARDFEAFGIDGELQEMLRVLSIFRRFNINTLQALQSVEQLPKGDCGELLPRIARTNLVKYPSEEDPFYSDAIVRKLLLIEMRLKGEQRYQALNDLAYRIYRLWLSGLNLNRVKLSTPSGALSVAFALEAFYHFLQQDPRLLYRTPIQDTLQELLDQLAEQGLDDEFRRAASADSDICDRLQQLGFSVAEIQALFWFPIA